MAKQASQEKHQKHDRQVDAEKQPILSHLMALRSVLIVSLGAVAVGAWQRAACCATRTIMGRPAMSARGLLGRRVEASRAGIKAVKRIAAKTDK